MVRAHDVLSLTEMFASFGAPLANQRWPWGSMRSGDGATFLRVWHDECGKINKRRAVRITATDYFSDKPENLGYAERLKHIDHIRSGNPVFLPRHPADSDPSRVHIRHA